jgi:uncharacterized protein involved in outer membrane biogenesis
MRRTSLIILATAGGLVALLLIAVAIAIWRVDPNDFVAPIQARIKEATGRDVAIRGGVDLKLSLTPKLVARDVTVANAAWGTAPQMLAAKQVEIEVALVPLLSKRFEVIRLDLVEPTIALETDRQGHGNWEFGGGATPSPTGAQPVAASPAAFGVGNVAVTRGTLTYRDGKSGQITRVAIDGLALSARNAQSPVNAEFRGTIDNVAISLTGNLGPLESLVQRKWPYPVALSGEIEGQKANVAAKLRMEQGIVHVDDLTLALGPNTLTGTLTVTTGGARPLYTLKLTAPVLVLSDAPLAVAAVAPAATTVANKAATATSQPSRYVFSDRPLPLAVLRSIDAVGDVSIGRLKLDGPREITGIEASFTLKDGRLDAPKVKAAASGGTLDGRVTLDVPATGSPALVLFVDGRNLDLGTELALLGINRDVRGGKTAVKVDARARGASLHDWMSTANGHVTVVVGPATMANTKLDLDSAIDRLSKAANPFREKDPTTEIKCAVAKLPLTDGIARIDRSLALETQKIGVSSSGTLDFRNETLDLTFKPQLREGIAIDIPQVAELVRLRGTFRKPEVTVDAMASVTTIARIGAAVGTGGISELGVALIGVPKRMGPGPCAVALGTAAEPRGDSAPPATAAAPAAAPAEAIGKALGKLFSR